MIFLLMRGGEKDIKNRNIVSRIDHDDDDVVVVVVVSQ